MTIGRIWIDNNVNKAKSSDFSCGSIVPNNPIPILIAPKRNPVLGKNNWHVDVNLGLELKSGLELTPWGTNIILYNLPC